LYFVTVTFLSLLLDVLSVWVLHAIFKLIFWMVLKQLQGKLLIFHYIVVIKLKSRLRSNFNQSYRLNHNLEEWRLLGFYAVWLL
jgi:hypothetical protein